MSEKVITIDAREERCKVCGETWKVSVKAKKMQSGYMCPVCCSVKREESKKIK